MHPNTASSLSADPPGDRPGPRTRRARMTLMIGVLSLVSIAALLGIVNRDPQGAVTSMPKVQADKTGVTIAEGAAQWEYVRLAVAQEGPVLPPLPAPARVGFDEKRTASIGAPLAGRIEQVVVRLGDAVKPGDKLFSVRSRDFAELDKELATSRETVTAKRRVRDRTRELFELNAVPEKEVLAAETELKQAELAARAAEAKQRSLSVVAAGDNLFWVCAPRAGTIVSLDVFASQEVTSERGEPLIRISDMEEVLVVADVPEMDATDLAVGAEAIIRTRDGVERSGKIEHVAAVVDPQCQTVGVRVRAANTDHALKPNAFVEVTFKAQQQKRIVQVTEDAVVSDGDRSTVFVLAESTRFEKRHVQPGRRQGGLVEIRAGLVSGTRYAAKGALLLLNQVELAD